MALLHEIILRRRETTPGHLAVIDAARLVSYAGLRDEVAGAAGWLQRQAPRGSRVGLMLGNTVDAATALLAVPAAGLVAVPLDPDVHPRNLAAILDDSGADLLVASDRLRALAEQGRPGLRVVSPEEYRREDPVRFAAPPGQSGAEVACLLYTTGTTGPRKGVMLSHDNLLAATANMNAFMQPGPWIVESIPMRLSHSFGFARLRAVLDAGGTAVLEEGLARVDRVLGNAAAHGVNAMSSVPAGFGLLLDHYLEPFTAVGPRLRLVEIGSAPMPARHREQLARVCPNARICMHYGLTEASRAAFLDFRADAAFAHTAGRPAPNVEIRIAGADGKPSGQNEPGEILVKGAMVAAGYWRRPDLTAAAFAGGWLRTGDVGFLDAAGYLHLTGRKEEILNLGGMKVAAGEVEERLRAHANVLDAAVAMSPSTDSDGPGLQAFVVPRDPDGFADFPGLRAHCLRELEAYKVPRTFLVVDQLPRTSSGKLQRHRLAELTPKRTWNSFETRSDPSSHRS